MSMTKDKKKRDEHDYYPTPPWAIKRFLERAHGRLPSGLWLEPAAGDGTLVKTVNTFYEKHNVENKWTCVELQNKFKAELSKLTNECNIADYRLTEADKRFNVCITNPPYKIATEVIKKAIKESDCVAMLLRLNFLSSEKRRDWLAENTPDVYVLPNRPQFRWKGSDATEYGWFVWDRKSSGKIEILDLTPKKIRAEDKLKMRKIIESREKAS